MISGNLRHLRVFLAVVDTGSATLAADLCRVSQPAVTQAVGKIERLAGGALFYRRRQGFVPTERGTLLTGRVRRAFALLDAAMGEISPRLRVTVTTAQLHALIAVREAENFTLAARRMGVTQPTVHRAVTQLEQEVARPLFERTSFGMVATRQCQKLAQAAQLAFSELTQAETDLAEFDGRQTGRIVIGALPLSRTVVLPKALARFRAQRPTLPVTVVDGIYTDLLAGLRRGEIDFVIGALRDPLPIDDVVQERLFDDSLVFLVGNHHPLAGRPGRTFDELADYPWVVPRTGTPSREQFDAFFAAAGKTYPSSIIEAGSILFMREVLDASDHLGCISRQQADAEVSKGLLSRLDVAADWPARAIGLTMRVAWTPTRSQALVLDLVREAAAESAV